MFQNFPYIMDDVIETELKRCCIYIAGLCEKLVEIWTKPVLVDNTKTLP